MKRGVLLLIVLNVYALCDGNRFDDFLHEKQEFLEKVDELFDTLYSRGPPHELADSPAVDDGDTELSAHPLSSPELPATSSSSGDDNDSIELVVESAEHENYRPLEEGGHREDAHEDAGSGSGSGAGGGDQEDGSAEVFVEVRNQTSAAVEAQCSSHLKAEVKTCVELSLNVRGMVAEMGRLVAHTGYYNVTPDSDYLAQFFRVCMSSILTPPGCYRDDGEDGVIERATAHITAFVHRKEGLAFALYDARNFNCFGAHLFFLKTCLGEGLTNQQLEGLVRTVMLHDRDEGESVCSRFLEVQRCFSSSMGKCEDYTSPAQVEDMFQVTLKEVTSCSVKTHSAATTITSLGAVVLFVISILTCIFL